MGAENNQDCVYLEDGSQNYYWNDYSCSTYVNMSAICMVRIRIVRCLHCVLAVCERPHVAQFAIEIDLGVHCSRKGVGSKKNQKVHQLPNFELLPAA